MGNEGEQREEKGRERGLEREEADRRGERKGGGGEWGEAKEKKKKEGGENDITFKCNIGMSHTGTNMVMAHDKRTIQTENIVKAEYNCLCCLA